MLFAFGFAWKSTNLFSHSFFLLEVGHSYHSTQFLNTLLVAHISPFLFCAVFDPGLTSTPAHIFVSGSFNTARCFYFLRVTFHIHAILFFCFNPAIHLSVRSFFCPTVATNSYSSWEECPSNVWTLPAFSEL